MLNKKILFLAPLPNDSNSVDGYINAAEGIRRILVGLNIKDLKVVNLSAPVNPEEFPDHEYDLAYLICNPYIFPQEGFQRQVNQFLSKAKKVYIQIVWELSDFPMSWQWMWGFLGSMELKSVNICGTIHVLTTLKFSPSQDTIHPK